MNIHILPASLYLCLLSFTAPTTAPAQIIANDSVLDGGNFEKAAFRLWFREDIKSIKGVIVLVPGSNGDGRDLVFEKNWQELAATHEMALMGCFITDINHDNMAIESYADVKNGSGAALEDVLSNFAVIVHHPELSEAPLALWGMSAGGEFNYEFVCWKPKRVIAFVVNKGGIYYTSLAPPAAWEVPGIFFTGAKDSPFRNNIIKGIFSINRRFGAKWVFVEEPGTAHEFENSALFALDFFDQVIPVRLASKNKDSSFPLAAMGPNGYIGKIDSKEISPYQEKERIAGLTCWLPNKEIAGKWLKLVK